MILLELIPHCLKKLEEEINWVSCSFSSQISGFNIPDIKRIPVRSLEAALFISKGYKIIPHIRSIDKNLEEHLFDIQNFIHQGGTELLIVHGDVYANQLPTFLSSLTLIREVKKAFPHLLVFAALDPYRSSFEEEMRYIEQKIEVGANGFFTQPFFDLKLAEKYLSHLSGQSVFLGSSPILTESSKRYWENQNKVQFPYDFSIDFYQNIQFTHHLIQLSQSYSQHIYLMPIKVSIQDYLNALFKKNYEYKGGEAPGF